MAGLCQFEVSRQFDLHGFGLAALCTCVETVELWIDPSANGQLELIWLLDYLQRHDAIDPRLLLRPTDQYIGVASVDELAALKPPTIPITSAHIDLGSKAWAAYRAPTPQAWSDLLCDDLSPLPRLRNAVLMLQRKPLGPDRVGRGDSDWSRRLQPAQPDPSLVGRHRTHQCPGTGTPSRRR